ncbi:MAG: hypothetical protein WDM96_18420 [Lacunisphaera sp.]
MWLRAGQPGPVWQLLPRIAELASPTGQWPEAIHPRTGGGCMGDGQHIWAAAEWLMLIRNLFVREERNHLVIGAGIAPEWLSGGAAALTRTLTPRGPVGVRFTRGARGVEIQLGRRLARVRPGPRAAGARLPSAFRSRRRFPHHLRTPLRHMKICMMTNTYLPHVGGVARSVSTFVDEYRRLGHEVLVVAPQAPRPDV